MGMKPLAHPKFSPKLAGLFFSASFSASLASTSLLLPRVVVRRDRMSALDWNSRREQGAGSRGQGAGGREHSLTPLEQGAENSGAKI